LAFNAISLVLVQIGRWQLGLRFIYLNQPILSDDHLIADRSSMLSMGVPIILVVIMLSALGIDIYSNSIGIKGTVIYNANICIVLVMALVNFVSTLWFNLGLI
jgi:hypothetical protein